jgi:hypothetical protein
MKLPSPQLSTILLLALTAGCNNSDKNSSKADAGLFSCSVTRNGELLTCTQYKDLSGTTLTAIQSECELRSNEGYSWAVAGCPTNTTVGTCELPTTPQKPAVGIQHFYGAVFSADEGIAAEMCRQQGGSFTEKT